MVGTQRNSANQCFLSIDIQHHLAKGTLSASTEVHSDVATINPPHRRTLTHTLSSWAFPVTECSEGRIAEIRVDKEGCDVGINLQTCPKLFTVPIAIRNVLFAAFRRVCRIFTEEPCRVQTAEARTSPQFYKKPVRKLCLIFLTRQSLLSMNMWLLLWCLWENILWSQSRRLTAHQPNTLALLYYRLQTTIKWGGSFNQQNTQMIINMGAEEMRICKCFHSLEILWVLWMESNWLGGNI